MQILGDQALLRGGPHGCEHGIGAQNHIAFVQRIHDGLQVAGVSAPGVDADKDEGRHIGIQVLRAIGIDV